MRKVLLVATMLALLPPAVARADGLDFRELYGKAKSFAESLLPAPPPKAMPKVPAAEIDPKMALVPRDEGRLRIIAPPGSPGGNQKLDPR